MEILQNTSWQDLVIALAQLLLFLALLPSIFSKDKPNWGTSLLTFIVLAVLGVTYLTLGLVFGSIFAFLTAVAWGILLIQSILRKK